MTWPPPILVDSDQKWDEYTDWVAEGLLDSEGFPPARLPGRPLRNSQNVAAPHRRDHSAVPGTPAESHGQRGDVPLPASPRSVAPLETDGVPWSRDAA